MKRFKVFGASGAHYFRGSKDGKWRVHGLEVFRQQAEAYGLDKLMAYFDALESRIERLEDRP